jgi:hypothetical protein
MRAPKDEDNIAVPMNGEKMRKATLRRLLRHRPSPAMVVACIALSAALGGTSYAAIKLPANSVGTKQLRKNAVTSIKVRDNALTGADVLESSLGRVPLARSAINASRATNATNATNAANAVNAVSAASAASAANADKLDGLDSLDLLPGGTLPSGKTIRGNWIVAGSAAVNGETFHGSISFGYTLSAAPTANYVPFGAPPPGSPCPGTVSSPQAAPGHLCVYELEPINAGRRGLKSPGGPEGSANAYGTTIFDMAIHPGGTRVWGTWAVTAP